MSKIKPNWLFRGLIGVFLTIHIVIFLHISGLYNSKALNYIELTMQNISKPTARAISRPRHGPRNLFKGEIPLELTIVFELT